MTLAERIGQWVWQLELDAVPAEVIESIKDRLIDTLGVALAGRHSDAGRAIRTAVGRWRGPEEASVLGEAVRLPAPSVALINGTYAHSLDFDDTHLPSLIHPSAPLVPAVLAVGEASFASGTRVVTALAVGYEVFCSLAMAQYDRNVRNSVLFEKGLHATSILGTIANAVACAKVMGRDAETITNALAVACSMGGGILEANRSGGSVKKVHGGWAAHAGVCAAEFAASGVTGPAAALEGDFGFFRAYCGDRWSPGPLDELGTIWRTPEICYKPYPCNVFTHALVDAAKRFRAQGIEPVDIARIRIGTAAASWRAIGDPIGEKRRPRSPYHAKFSAPYVFATALLGGGGLGLAEADFSPARLGAMATNRLMDVTDVVKDAECDRIFPDHFPARVQLELKDGGLVEEWVPANSGGPQLSLGRDDLIKKLEANVGPSSEPIVEACLSLDRSASLATLTGATSGTGAVA